MSTKRPWIIAHRGASEDAPENTLAAFSLAVDQGADGVECDLQRSSDGEVVLIHDEALARTTDGQGAVAERSAAELGALDAGSWKHPRYAGQGVPRLEQLLALPAVGRLLLELKHGGPEGMAALARRSLALVERAGATERAVFMSFDRAALEALRATPARAVWLREADAPWAPREAADLWGLGVAHAALDAARVAEAHALGLRVFAWTVNDEARARALADAGVDAIITDAPARIRAALG